MGSEIDLNRIAADLIHKVFTDTVRSVSSGVRDIVTKLIDAVRKDLSAYLSSTISKCCLIKTPIINRDTPIYLFDIYVHTKLVLRNKTYTDDEFITQLSELKSVVIAGNAGSGKSMFMRYLFVTLCEKGYGRIPLFVELRNLNSFAIKELLAFMYYSITGPGGKITQDQFEAGLKNGAFSVILDGFDEVDVDQRKVIEQQILQFREKFPDILLIVSSRPDPENRFGSWSRFHVAHVKPMDTVQIRELINKIDYDVRIKREFLKALEDGLSKSHGSFISNPLLCIMMLVTFSQTGQISARRHVFYEQAFDALFFLHDSAKEGVYQRKTYAKLPIDEFRNCLSAFCIVSYVKEKFSFTQGELRELISQALKIEKKAIDIKDFINDMIESTCLLQIEGTDYVFTHRSFQEYFAAFFIARSPAANLGQLLDQLSKRREDDVTHMAFAMNRHLLEREWIVPRLREFKEISSKLTFEKDLCGSICALFGPLGLQVNGKKVGEFYYQEIPPQAAVWLAIMALYHEHFAQLFKWLTKQQQIEAPRIQEAYLALKAKSDARITTEEGKVPPGREKRHSYRMILNSNDNEWLKKTRIGEYFTRHQKAMFDLLSIIETDVKNQKDILSSLIPS